MAKAKAAHNGSLKLGQVMAACYSDGAKSDQAKKAIRTITFLMDQERSRAVLGFRSNS